jgi:hypothetical protein
MQPGPINIMREGTAKELGYECRSLGWMRRRGEAQFIGQRDGQKVWRILIEPGDHPGEAFRRLRAAKGWTLDALYDESGYNARGIPLYERTGDHMTMMSLYLLLDCMGCRFADLHGEAERLPTETPIGLADAVKATLAECGVDLKKELPRSLAGSIPYPRKVKQMLQAINETELEFYRRLDAKLRWSK